MSESTDSSFDLVGPFEYHRVRVYGREVPLLTAQIHDGGMMTLVLDGRLGLELSTPEAERVVPFLADVIAVAMGYASFPSEDCPEPVRRPDFPKLIGLITPVAENKEQAE